MESPLYPGELVMGDDYDPNEFANRTVDGEVKSMGLVRRDFRACPVGYTVYARPFDLPLIPESEWQDRLDEQIKAKAQLSNLRDVSGPGGAPIPSRDQNGRGYSHTEDTEVLTEKGWVRWPDWNHSDLLATVNPLTHAMEFQAATEWHASEYRGETYHSTNRRLDFGVTNYHRMYVRKWDEARRTLSDHYTFQNADSLGWYVGLLAAPSGHLGVDLERVSLDGDREYLGDDFLALLSLICSDGYASDADGHSGLVSFCCYRPDRREKVAALASRVGFREQVCRPGVWVRYDAHTLSAWIKANCYVGATYRAPFKRVPDVIKSASMRQINHFLDFFGDKNHGEDAQPVFYSSSKRMIDDLQELHLRVGRRSTIEDRKPRRAVMRDGKVIQGGPSYVLCVATTDRLCIDRKKHIETDRCRGLVYCATVPNGLLVTRRNDSVLISGNCWAHSTVSAALLARAKANEPYADLSAYAIACIIKRFRDEGGWNAESVQFLAERGCPTSEFWPQRSVDKSNDNPKTWANAKEHIALEWMDLDPRQMWPQLVTALLSGFSLAGDFNWWGHSVGISDLVALSPRKIRIWNSWGDSWSANGMGVLEGSKALPDAAIAVRAVRASQV